MFTKSDKNPKPNKFTIYLGKAIKQAREESKFTQEELASQIYKHRITLSEIESGKADIDAGTLGMIAILLKKPLSFFYPPFLIRNMQPETIGQLEHELLIHFTAIRNKELQELAIKIIKTIKEIEE